MPDKFPFKARYKLKELNAAPENKEGTQLDLLFCIIKSNESKQVGGKLPSGELLDDPQIIRERPEIVSCRTKILRLEVSFWAHRNTSNKYTGDLETSDCRIPCPKFYAPNKLMAPPFQKSSSPPLPLPRVN